MSQSSVKTRRQLVVLTFSEIDCRRLQIAGDFNDWVPDRDIETRSINGCWQKVFTAEPGNSAEVPNDSGGVNSLLQVRVHH